MRVIALVDGEHHPPVVRWGLASARAAGYRVVLALVVGGAEKLGPDGRLDLGSVPAIPGQVEPMRRLAEAIEEHRPDAVLDLSDEPVLGYRRRMELASVALAHGVPYVGPDFRFDPPLVEAPLPVPTLAVIGTGKRVGKTAVGGHVARVTAAAGLDPVVVAMGRGGPPGLVFAGPDDVTVEALLARVDQGEHAASDYLEDALMSGVTTVGARRAGGGLGGRPFVTNMAEAARLAAARRAGLVIMEGSGASIPTVPWDAGIMVVPEGLPEEHLAGYLGPLRVLLSDLAILIIEGDPSTRRENLFILEAHVRRLRADIRVVHAALQPVPMGDVKDRDVFLATTAQPEVARHLGQRLERTAGCRIVATTANLGDRVALQADLDAAPPFDVLVTELKAAGVDVAARTALGRGAGVVFLDNRPFGVGGDGDLDDLVREVASTATTRAGVRLGETR